MTRKIIDTPYSVEKIAKSLAQTGVECIIRYYNRENTHHFPNKRLTIAEAEAICESGMSLAVVFQQNHRDLADFTPARAAADAQAALDIATDKIGQPAGSTIYVSVDNDFFRTSELKVIVDYFHTVKAAFTAAGAKYRLGVYGSGAVATALLDSGNVDNVWIARALGWSGSRQFLKTSRWHLYQDAVDLKFQSIDYDSNITAPGLSDFGQFVVGTDHRAAALGLATIPVSSSKTLFEVTARSTLNLRGGPGLEFSASRTLATGQRLYGIKRVGDWLQVDLEGDGIADGFVHSDYVKTLAGDREDIHKDGLQPVDIAYRELELQIKEYPGAAVNPRIALYYQSLDAAHHNDDEVPWCSYFANYCFATAGRKGSGKANARSWLNWGTPVTGTPRRGDILVFWRGEKSGWQGHVGFYTGETDDAFLVLGGNQADSVSIRPQARDRLLGIRRG